MSRARIFHLRGRHRCLLRDEHGGILVLFAISTGMIFGFMALVWDIGRTMSTASEMQNFADQLAVAAAAELDGDDGAIARAQDIVTDGFFDGLQTFAGGGNDLDAGDATLTFYASVPDDDTAPLTDVTISDRDALYVEVDVQPRTVTNLFAGVVNALTGTAIADSAVSARALAGRKRLSCSTTPFVFCAPDSAAYELEPGRMISLEMKGKWRPAEFGVLADNFRPESDCGNSGTSGAAVVGCVTGIVDNVTRCYDQTGVTIVNTISAREVAGGLNSRFDVYTSTLSSKKDNANFAPAPSVVKAVADDGGSNCIDDLDDVDDLSELPEAERSVPLPRDACFEPSGICSDTGSRLGTGITAAELDDYWAVNHGGVRPSATTRYELYQAEVAAASSPFQVLQKLTATESGAPICYKDGLTPTNQGSSRRLLNAAVIDCSNSAGLPNGGLVEDVPVLEFVQLFMTEPAELSNNKKVMTLWVEEVQVLRPGADGLGNGRIRDVVHLVR